MSARFSPVLLVLLLAACRGPATTPPTGTFTQQPPDFGNFGSAAPSSQPSGPILPAQAGIQLINREDGAASFVTVPGQKLTVAVSAGASGSQSDALELAAKPRLAYALPWGDKPTDLTRRPGRKLQQAAAPRTLGSTDTFWVNAGDSSTVGDHRRTCTLRRISPNAYLYVDQEATAGLTEDRLDQLVKEWEERVYPKVTKAFGQEVKPGIDGENRVFIVLSPAVHNFGADKNLMGYFWSRDAMLGTPDAHTNQKEALFMTDLLFERPPLTSFGTMAHEFQHLINFSRKSARLGYRLTEETWLDEGLSMYAMDVAGYGLPAGDYHIAKDLRAFQQEPQNYTLTQWGANPPGFAYGQSYLFVKYLVDRYGEEALPAILGADVAGVAAVESYLRTKGTTFEAFFRDWGVTNVVTGSAVATGTIYNYKGIGMTGTYKSSTGLEDIVLRGFEQLPGTGGEQTVALKPWGTAYYAYASDAPRIWDLTLAAGTPGRLLGAAIVP